MFTCASDNRDGCNKTNRLVPFTFVFGMSRGNETQKSTNMMCTNKTTLIPNDIENNTCICCFYSEHFAKLNYRILVLKGTKYGKNTLLKDSLLTLERTKYVLSCT